MYEYPTIPRHGADIDDLWSGELVATEKVDGTRLWFALYDERYREMYPAEVLETGVADGEVVSGTGSSTRWVVDPAKGNIIRGEMKGFEGPLKELLTLDVQTVKDAHDTYDGAAVFFCEAMDGQSVIYDEPPALIGIDVYAPAIDGYESIDAPNETSEHTFDGFVQARESFELFERLGVTPATPSAQLPIVDANEVEPGEITVPMSNHGITQAEGIVFRNRRTGTRLKMYSSLFDEADEQSHSIGDDKDNPVNRFIDSYCTPRRIQKMVWKMVHEEEKQMNRGLIEPVRHRVYDDIWRNEWRTIKDLDYEVEPSRLKNAVSKQTADVVNQMVEIGIDPGQSTPVEFRAASVEDNYTPSDN